MSGIEFCDISGGAPIEGAIGREISDTGDGNITLMRMKYCPVGAYFGVGRYCGLCKKYSFAL